MTALEQPTRLTAFSHGASCACKPSPTDLRTVLGQGGPILARARRDA